MLTGNIPTNSDVNSDEGYTGLFLPSISSFWLVSMALSASNTSEAPDSKLRGTQLSLSSVEGAPFLLVMERRYLAHGLH